MMPGRPVLAGWSVTREAARAADDALPPMEDARVAILRVIGVPGEMADTGSNDLAAAPSRHRARVAVTVTHRDRSPGSVGEMLPREADGIGAGPIVAGAFGHSRAYDVVIGAASRELLAPAPLPVLCSK
jgi:nucleotide-binding universal stress UspA family protein